MAAAGGEHSSYESDPLTLTRYLLSKQPAGATGEFTLLMNSIQLACKVISGAVRKAGIANLYGLQGGLNVQGEEVKKLDILSNENFMNCLKFSRNAAVLVSEEDDEPVFLEPEHSGKYVVVFDPLDGSSNIDCNVSVGSIFGIYKRKSAEGTKGTLDDVLQPGTELVAAGYCMYGSSTQLVLTVGKGVSLFTLDPSIGEFMLTDAEVRVPEKPKRIYSINEGNYSSFPAPVKRFIDGCKAPKDGKEYSLRYVGSMVADVHRTLLYGGIFLYPSTTAAPAGKLRLLYEANPMSMILEQAGGLATTGRGRILELAPTGIHQRCPVILGCSRDVEALLALIAEDDAAKAAAAADAAAAAAGGGGGGGGGGAGEGSA